MSAKDVERGRRAEGAANLNEGREVSEQCGGRYRDGCRIVVGIPVEGVGKGTSCRVTVRI